MSAIEFRLPHPFLLSLLLMSGVRRLHAYAVMWTPGIVKADEATDMLLGRREVLKAPLLPVYALTFYYTVDTFGYAIVSDPSFTTRHVLIV